MQSSSSRKFDSHLKDLRSKLDRLERTGHFRAPLASPPQPLAKSQEKLAGPLAQTSVANDQLEAKVFSRTVPFVSGKACQLPKGKPGPALALEEAVTGVEIEALNGGAMYLVESRISDLAGMENLDSRFLEILNDCSSPLHPHLAPFREESPIRPEHLLFVDIESAGLGSSPLFLIGTMVWENNGFLVKQFLARDYAEEAAVISEYACCANTRPLLVSFNGKSFDIPYIRTRGIATGTEYVPSNLHLDLLHISRRIWKGIFPDCKLQTLETLVCQRPRHDDIPGSEIPDAYHQFVHTGNARQIADIIKHNMLDLITLADIMTRLPA